MNYSDTPGPDLAKAQEVLTAALAAFDATSRELDLEYILIAGSLLGAVRHSGFIPWDDDVDVAMRLGDLERFVERAPAMLGSQYVIHSRETDPILGAQAKVYVDGTYAPSQFGEMHGMQQPAHGGLFIDVFVLYPVSGCSLLKHLERGLGWLVYVRPWALSMAKSPKVSRLRRVRWLAVASLPSMIVRAAAAWLRRCAQTRKSSRWGIGMGAINGRVTYTSDTLFPPSESRFHGIAVPVPADAHRALSVTFGPDYMTPPSEKERVSHARTVSFDGL